MSDFFDEHFKIIHVTNIGGAVPTMTTDEQIAQALEDMHATLEEVIESVGFNAFSTRVEKIESEAYDGFIPFTNGGWNAVASFDFYSEDSYSTDLITPFVEKDYQECVAELREKHGLAEDAVVQDHEEWEEWLTDWEQDDGTSTWFVYARACFYMPSNYRNKTGKPAFDLGLGINTDFGYGRDHIAWAGGVQTHWVWEDWVTVDDLTEAKLEEIKAAMIAAWVAN